MRLSEPRPASGGEAAPFGPVLVLDGWERMSLGAVRALGRRGVAVGTAGARRYDELTATSRYARWFDSLPAATGPAEPYERALAELVERRGYVAIVSCHDATLARLASIRLPVPTLARLDAAWHAVQDKLGLARIAREIGVGYPPTEPVESPADAAAALARRGGPVYVKSRTSAVAGPARVGFERGAARADTPEEATDAARRLAAEGLSVIVQPPIGGVTKYSAILLRREGATEFRYAMRFVREFPRTGGIGVTLDSLDAATGEAAEVTRVLERVCERVGYEGIIQAELYRDAAGKLHLVDVNPRLWGSVWFAERLGIRPVERSIRAALRLPPLPPPRYAAGRRFHTVSGEVRWLLEDPSPGRATLRLVAALRPEDAVEWVDLSDPVATVHYMSRGVWHALTRQR